MRTVTELGFTAPAFPERAAVQEAPAKGESFFDTLSRAGENSKDAAKVTDDKPENTNQNNENSETAAEKTQSERETPKVEGETEKPEQTETAPDIIAQMLALGRMVTAIQPEQKVEVAAVVTEADVTASVENVTAESGEGTDLMQMLTPVENGEEMHAMQDAEGAAVTAENFADAMTQTLAEQLGEQPVETKTPIQPVDESTIEPMQNMNAPEAEIVQAVPKETAEVVLEETVQTVPEETMEGVSEEAVQAVPEETAEVVPEETEAPMPAVDEQTEEIAVTQAAVQEETAGETISAQPRRAEVQRTETPADVAQTEVVESAETPENTDFSQTFENQSEGFEAETEATAGQLGDTSETEIDLDTETVQNVPMQQILRNRFAADGAVQNIDNAELAQAIEKAIDRFAEDFRIAEVDVQHITIRLDPEELGSMSITVAAENNVITAKIVTDNKEAASLLSAQIEQFLETMEQKGIKVDKAEVTYNSQLDLGSQSPNEHSGGTHGGRRAIEAISAVEMVEVEEEIRLDETAVAAVQDEATNYYVFDDKYVPNHVYKV